MSFDSPTVPAGRRRERLHSLTFFWFRRAFALLLAADALRVLRALLSGSLSAGAAFWQVLHAVAFLLLAYGLWFWVRSVFATVQGLELISGGKVRSIPWARVVDLREMPWMTLHPPWYPKQYQLDLSGGESLDFVGRRNARAIAVAVWQRGIPNPGPSASTES